ncbi:MAG: hypothetical protein MUD12_11470 [Spirochaetes bacterium]|jgi:hypothetical protein|nr:hypothetical protein [Spirochaetota bacterium]
MLAAHFAMGIGTKKFNTEIPLLLLFVSAMLPDILLYSLSVFPGFKADAVYWSHGLFMCAVWSLAAALAVYPVFRKIRPALATGLLVMSHWVLDFISWPLASPDGNGFITGGIPLMFRGSPETGLGLFSTPARFIAGEATGLLVIAFFVFHIYYRGRRKNTE